VDQAAGAYRIVTLTIFIEGSSTSIEHPNRNDCVLRNCDLALCDLALWRKAFRRRNVTAAIAS
jgi:hypothetical protein